MKLPRRKRQPKINSDFLRLDIGPMRQWPPAVLGQPVKLPRQPVTLLRRLRAVALAAITVIVTAASGASFAESYHNLWLWADHHDLAGIWADIWPLMIDAFIAVGELALLVALIDGWKLRSRLGAWAVTGVGLAASVAAQVGHVAGHDIANRLTAAVPPLAASFSLAVGLGVLKRVANMGRTEVNDKAIGDTTQRVTGRPWREQGWRVLWSRPAPVVSTADKGESDTQAGTTGDSDTSGDTDKPRKPKNANDSDSRTHKPRKPPARPRPQKPPQRPTARTATPLTGRALAADVIAKNPALTNPEVAERTGVNLRTVQRAREDLETAAAQVTPIKEAVSS